MTGTEASLLRFAWKLLAVELDDPEVAEMATVATGYSEQGLRSILARWQDSLLQPEQVERLPLVQRRIARFALNFLLANQDDDFVCHELVCSLGIDEQAASEQEYEQLIAQIRAQLQAQLQPLADRLTLND